MQHARNSTSSVHRERVVWMAALVMAGVVGCGRDLGVEPVTEGPAFGAAAPVAKISIGEQGVNRVGAVHTVTGLAQVAADPGQPFLAVADGTRIDFAIATGPGSLSASSCTTSGGSGACSVTLTSMETGVTEVTASSSFTVAGTTFNLATDFSGENSGPLLKTWVDAKIEIEPSAATNPVNAEHTFTVTVWKDFGDDNGFIAVDGETVSAEQSGSLAPLALGGTCTDGGVTDGAGQCTFTANSSTPGTLTLSASSTVTFGGATSPVSGSTLASQDLSFTVTTDGTGDNSDPATKTWVGSTSTEEGDICISYADYSASAGGNTASGTFKVQNTSDKGVPANVVTIDLKVWWLVNRKWTDVPNTTCVVTDIKDAAGQSRGPGLPYIIEPEQNGVPSGEAFFDFTCTRSEGTFEAGTELRLIQQAIIDPGKDNPYKVGGSIIKVQ
jgi:hypothetical protein